MSLHYRSELQEAQKHLQDTERQNEELTQRIAILESSLRQHESLLLNQPALRDWEIERFKQKGLKDPQKDIIADLAKHSELIPYEGVLGGTMGFYFPERIWLLTEKWALAYFEDGHIPGYMLLKYEVSDNGEISWKVVASYLEGDDW